MELIEENEKAYNDLIMSIDTTTAAGKVAFSLVRSSKTKDYPDGNAVVAWKRLRQKFMPDSAPTMTKLQQQFYSSKLEKNQDPDVWMTKMEYIRVQLEELSSEMTDIQFMTQIINNLTDDYEVLVEIVGRRLMDDLTIEELRNELNLRFERLQDKRHNNNNNSNNSNDDNKPEHAMYAGGKFKGKCNHCGKIGHKVKDCYVKDPSKKPQRNNNNNNSNNNNNNKFTGTCNYCGKVGHREAQCFKKQRETSGSNNNNDSAAPAVSNVEEKAEVVLMAFDGFRNIDNILNKQQENADYNNEDEEIFEEIFDPPIAVRQPEHFHTWGRCYIIVIKVDDVEIFVLRVVKMMLNMNMILLMYRIVF